jgi:hypothetical protein
MRILLDLVWRLFDHGATKWLNSGSINPRKRRRQASVVMWRCASLKCAATGGRDYLGEEAAV